MSPSAGNTTGSDEDKSWARALGLDAYGSRRIFGGLLCQVPGGNCTDLVTINPSEAMGERSPKRMRISVAWFPRVEYERALATWAELAEEWDGVPHAEYCRRLEARMRELTAHGILIGSVAPISIDEYVAWCNERGDNPPDEESRAAYAADLERLGGTVPWPPRGNERCWCGSSAKYKSCCGSVSPASPEPLLPT